MGKTRLKNGETVVFQGSLREMYPQMVRGFDLKELGEWTSLKETIACCQSRDRFFKLKRSKVYIGVFEDRFDEEDQLEVFNDLRDLMVKAVDTGWKREDETLLMKYLQQNSGASALAPIGDYPSDSTPFPFSPPIVGTTVVALDIPISEWSIIASSDSKDMNLTPRYIDTEINKRLFYHVWLVLTREEQVGVCTAEDCEQFLIPQPRGSEQLYCSQKCRSRQNVRNFRRRQKSRQ